MNKKVLAYWFLGNTIGQEVNGVNQSTHSQSIENTLVRFAAPTSIDQGFRIDHPEQNDDVVTWHQGIQWMLGSCHEHKKKGG